MELNQQSVRWLLEWLSIFPLGKTPFLGRGNAPAASPAPDLPCTGAAHGWKRHVARERGNQFFHKYSSSWSLVGRCARQGGYFPFPTWKDEFSFSDCLRQANAALRQPSCPLISSLPDGRDCQRFAFPLGIGCRRAALHKPNPPGNRLKIASAAAGSGTAAGRERGSANARGQGTRCHPTVALRAGTARWTPSEFR